MECLRQAIVKSVCRIAYPRETKQKNLEEIAAAFGDKVVEVNKAEHTVGVTRGGATRLDSNEYNTIID